MARIPLRAVSEMDEELQNLVGAKDRTPLELGSLAVYAHKPQLAKAYARFVGEVRANRQLSNRLVELVRLRVAFHNQCRLCSAIRYDDAVQDGVDEDLVCQLEAPDASNDLTESERAAIRFADLLATDHLAINDQTIERLRDHFTDEEIVELGINIGVFLAFGRLSMAWDVVDELPERFRVASGAVVTPWGAEDPIVVGKQT